MPKDISPAIKCPHCGKTIPLTEALLYPFKQKWTEELGPQFEKKLKEEKEKALRAAQKTIKDLKDELKGKDLKVEEAQNFERKLRQELRKVEERQKHLDLEVARKVDEEKREIDEKHHLKLSEKDEQINKMVREIDELKRKAEQTSPLIRGDALQHALEHILVQNFPDDEVKAVRRFASGADVIQRVRENGVRVCGTILWESKNTKKWNKSWIAKLKEDQRNENADIAVLATIALPEDIQHFDAVEGVWVTSLSLAPVLAKVLRSHLIEIATNELALVNKDQKVELLYGYLTSPQYKQRVEAIVDALCSMQGDLVQERRAMEGIWAKREKEIDKAISGAAGFYGDIRGIIGAEVPQIGRLQLPSSTET